MELCHISDLVHIYGCIVSSYVIGNDEVGLAGELE